MADHRARVTGTAGWAGLAWRDRRAAGALALWLAPMVPYLGGVRMAFWAADRHLLLASLGPALVLGWAVESMGRARLGAVVLAGVLAATSWARVPAWRDSRALWEADVQCPGEHWARWYKLGMERAKAGDMAGGADAFDRSLALYPEQRAVLAAWALAALASDGWSEEDRAVAPLLYPPPADERAWREVAGRLHASGAHHVADRVEAQIRR